MCVSVCMCALHMGTLFYIIFLLAFWRRLCFFCALRGPTFCRQHVLAQDLPPEFAGETTLSCAASSSQARPGRDPKGYKETI